MVAVESRCGNLTTVLVIDDERMICWSIEQTLRAAGHTVVAAETAAEGLRLYRNLHPGVVFLDVKLPDADGLAVLKCMKDEAGENSAPVIVMTAFDEGDTRAAALRLGACAYLRKPFDFDRLEAVVAEALASEHS